MLLNEVLGMGSGTMTHHHARARALPPAHARPPVTNSTNDLPTHRSRERRTVIHASCSVHQGSSRLHQPRGVPARRRDRAGIRTLMAAACSRWPRMRPARCANVLTEWLR